ncbi:MAG TPA: hypothetical protein DEP23_14740 [Ruminococcaceae bacterium]|nr:hypothetical protein [Oscillospiraceae bacterium]
MKNYKCIADLEKRLSDAVDEITSCADAYFDEGREGPYRALIDDLINVHSFDEQYMPLLTEMIRERVPDNFVEIVEDEIMLYPQQTPTKSSLPFSPERIEQIRDKAFNCIGGNHTSDGALYNTLVEQLEMSDEEIAAAGFEYLKEYFYDPDENADMKLE